MPRKLVSFLAAVGAALVSAAAAPALPQAAPASSSAPPAEAPATLESSVLVLEVAARPYRYRLLERATGRLLADHLATALRVGGTTAETYDLASVEKTEDGLEAKLAFSDSAHEARVLFRFASPEVLQVAVTYDQGRLENVTETFADQGEHYYGLWEHVDGGIDDRGVEQQMLGLRHLQDVSYASARAPFYVTSRGYGLYVQSEAPGRYAVAVKGRTVVSFDDDRLRYSLIYGPSYLEVFRRYNDLAGGSVMPPTWAFDSIWWRDDNHADWEENGVSSSQALALHDADMLARHRIRASALWLDRPYGTGRRGWGNMDFDETFPDPAAMIRELRERGLNLLLWIANRSANTLLEEGRRDGYLFSPDVYTDWPAADLRRPEAYAWLEKKLDAYVVLGVRGYKADRGEEAEMPDAAQNRLVTLLVKLAKEGLEARHPGDSFVFARNLYDTGRRYAAVWNGDTESTWGGLAVSVKHALRCGGIDMPMWGSDTGGYHRGTPTKELFARWLELSAWSTMMEVKIGQHRTPWIDYDPELVAIARAQAGTHHDLIPYTRSAVHEATRTGMPVLRQLLFDHPDDESLYERWDEYMFGPSILVAPVLDEGARRRTVYLPRGRWLDYVGRRTVYEGGRTVDAPAPLDVIPLFVKEGAIVPRGDILRGNDTWTPSWRPALRLEVFPMPEGASRFEYFTGQRVATIDAVTRGGVLTVDFSDLGATGVLEIALKGYGRVERNGQPVGDGGGVRYDRERQVLVVPFAGPTRVTVHGVTSLF
jgi:alpha-D-xyloside xylohydrolase